MSRLIAIIIGAWVMYCSMVGSYDGAIALLTVYVLTVWIDPFYSRHKKVTGAGNTDDKSKTY